MSGITVGDLWREYCDNEKWQTLKDIEVVPRKMVEMIMEECESLKITNYRYGNYCAGDNFAHIKNYAESLLKQFEEDKDEVI